MKRHGRGKRIWFAVCAVLLLAGVGCGAALRLLSLRLPSQREAERWQGENTREYSQISCFLPLNSTLDVSAVYTFRYAVLDALTAIGFEWDEDVYPFIDAWSCEGKLTITGEKATTDAPVIAVGGQFFEFHPLRLLDGSYISEDDFSFDRVLLDEALAWELFGGTALTGMSVQVNGAELVVGGVLEREQDSASRRAYGEEKGFFMSYETYAAISGKQGIGCYEVVLPETVKGYAAQLVGDKFPLGDGESLVNTGRFGYERLLALARDLPGRAAHGGKVVYPYWENAARITENECAVLAVLAMALLLPGVITAVIVFFRLLVRGRTALEETVLPKAKENVEEAVRVRARKRWEKKHGE